MLTISIDESGAFEYEQEENNNKPIFVAGIIYDDLTNKNETRREKERIGKYYEKVIADASNGNEGFSFPQALHSDGNRERDNKVVRPTKEVVRETFAEFVKSGTYKGEKLLKEDRKGEYYLYAYLCSENGISDYAKTNILTDDNFAANRYFHMSTAIVTRLALHNPLISLPISVVFDLASRSSQTYDSRKEKTREFYRVGFEDQSKDKNKRYYHLATADMYRSYLSKEMIRCRKTKVNVERFSVKPIIYNYESGDEFLYMADSLCSILGFEYRPKEDSQQERISFFDGKLKELCNEDKNMLFLYDDIDVLYQRAYEYFEEGDLYECLRRIYEAKESENEISKYYFNSWFKKLLSCIENTKDVSMFCEAVSRLNESLYKNSYVQDLAVFIFNELEKIAVNSKEEIVKKDRERVVGKLYETGISVYCHIGDSKNAEKYFYLYKEYLYATGIDDYLAVLNRMIVVELDNFMWDDALKNANEGLSNQRFVLDMKNEMEAFKNIKQDKSLGLAKAYSQLGQVYAFKKDPSAEEHFINALDMMTIGSANYNITLSYLLHYYIESGDYEKHNKWATIYFGDNEAAGKRFDYIMSQAFMDDPIINYKYALYVFVKGIVIFNEEVSERLLERLIDLNGSLKAAEKKTKKSKSNPRGKFVEMTGHPGELIYKYIAMLALKYGRKDEANECLLRCQTCIGNEGDTIKLIQMETQATLYKLNDGMEKYNEMLIKEEDFCKEHFPHIVSTGDFHEGLTKWLTFMYR